MNLFIMYLLHVITCHQFDVILITKLYFIALDHFFSSHFFYNLGLPPCILRFRVGLLINTVDVMLYKITLLLL